VNVNLTNHLAGFSKQPGVSTAEVELALSSAGIELPTDYLSLLRFANGCEGFLGDEYLRFYPADQLISLNNAFCTQEFLPGRFIFGSNGGGEAWAFDIRIKPAAVLKMPFIPMHDRYSHSFGTFEEFIVRLANTGNKTEQRRVNPAVIGKEIHEIKPIAFGGDPGANDNKAYLTPAEYAPYVVWWNRKYRGLTKT
jgi:hypothetical protein